MSDLAKIVLAADVRAFKARVSPMVELVDSLVKASTSLDADLRVGWVDFAKQWREYAHTPEGWFTADHLAKGGAYVRQLRSWTSLLSSQVYGVPDPAPIREVPLLPTFVTPNVVRDLKNKIGPRIHEIDTRASLAAGSLSAPFRSAWKQFVQGWSTFESEPEEWTHAAAQYDNLLGYEDVLPEWDDALGMAARPLTSSSGAGGSDSGAPAPRGPASPAAPVVIPGLPPGLMPVAPIPVPPKRESGSKLGLAIGGGALLLLLLSRRSRA